jgi:hypothetical protein
MAKFIGKGPPPTILTPQTLTPRVSQARVKPPVSARIQSPVDTSETSSADHRTDTAPLQSQVRAGMLKLELTYYGQEAAEPSILRLMAPTTEAADNLPDHVVRLQTRLFARDLGLTPEESRALVADLALVLA